VASLRPTLQAMQRHPDPAQREVWQLWERWISEIVADFWAVARVGVASTLGLIAVVSLPRVFVLRVDIGDPHPSPWIRVLLSCAIGNTLYPHRQWGRIAAMWASFYPLAGIDAARRDLFDRLRATMGTFVSLLAQHRPRSLRGRTLAEVLAGAERTPRALGLHFRAWKADPAAMYRAPPSLVFAAFGQARMDGRMSPEDESTLTAKLLVHWALAGTLRGAARCAVASPT
jgi:hypothetical protein